MAEIQYGEVGDVPAFSGANLKWMVNWLGGLISVTLIAGLVFWGYQLMVRDVSGIPVVRAIEGPMRITPLDPGGSNAEHQGLAVNNIAAVGEAEAPADRLVLAPKPTAVGENDPTAGQLAQISNQVATGLSQSVQDVVPASNVLSDGDEIAVVQDQSSLIEATLRLVEQDASLPVVGVKTISFSVAGVSKSLYPVRRPADLKATVGVETSAADAGVNFINPGDIPTGTRLAQLGAFESVDIAKQEWLKISGKFDVFMADKTRVIEQAQSGGKVFYRLRVHGFSDLSDARRFCSTLLAGQANCIPVVTR